MWGIIVPKIILSSTYLYKKRVWILRMSFTPLNCVDLLNRSWIDLQIQNKALVFLKYIPSRKKMLLFRNFQVKRSQIISIMVQNLYVEQVMTFKIWFFMSLTNSFLRFWAYFISKWKNRAKIGLSLVIGTNTWKAS